VVPCPAIFSFVLCLIQEILISKKVETKRKNGGESHLLLSYCCAGLGSTLWHLQKFLQCIRYIIQDHIYWSPSVCVFYWDQTHILCMLGKYSTTELLSSAPGSPILYRIISSRKLDSMFLKSKG
jgi:hypothetical protein